MSDRTEQLRQIRDEVLNLTESPLYSYRKQNGYFPVIGQGNHYADIMFIGEAPGENEAKTGVPFCGASGRVLDELIASIGLRREAVYITNIVKDRPPANRDPNKQEIELYSPFLVRQINIIQPKVIATLGRFSMEFILKLF
ncbi:MAG: uracil-DNA glycosylase, partial [Phototrophicales bacterium]